MLVCKLAEFVLGAAKGFSQDLCFMLTERPRFWGISFVYGIWFLKRMLFMCDTTFFQEIAQSHVLILCLLNSIFCILVAAFQN